MQTASLPSSISEATPNPAPPGLLTPRQAAAVSALSVFYWFVAAQFIRLTLPAGWFGGVPGAVLFALSVPGAWLLVRSVRRVGALRTDQLVAGVAVADAAALICDGVAFTWFPGLYGAPDADLRLGAAWLLWGVGVTLVWAVAGSRAR